jgi:hypothetical protein
MMSHVFTHPQVSSTDTTSPHTEHLYRSPALTFALDPVPHPALFATAFFAGAFFAAFFAAIPLSSFLIYACGPLTGHGSTEFTRFRYKHYRNHANSSNQEIFET